MPRLARLALVRYTSVALLALAIPIMAPVHAARLALPPTDPVIGGSIAVRAPATPDCLDPQKTALGASVAIVEEVVDTLLSMDGQGNIRPYLADRYHFSADGKTVTFFLHHGILFSNGDPLDANAVKFT